MNFQIFSFSPILISIFLRFPFSISDGTPDEYLYQSCANTFSCGSISGLGYPFSGNAVPAYCGYPGFDLKCKNNVTTIEINSMNYRVLGINQSTKTMRIVREDMMESTCPQDLANTTLDNSFFQFSSSYTSITFLSECPSSYSYSDSYSSTPSTSTNLDSVPSCSGSETVYYVVGEHNPQGCNKSVMVPISGSTGSVDSGNWTKLERDIRAGFDVNLKVDDKACLECTVSKGRCGYNVVNNQSVCYCLTSPFVTDTTCSGAVGTPTSPLSGMLTIFTLFQYIIMFYFHLGKR